MSFHIKKAERKNVKLRIGFWGASGSGKTYSALKFAKGFIGDWDKIAVLDTENSSAELYSHLGMFNHVPFTSPFSPQKYIEGIKFIESQPGIELIIIDSISHEWEGDGGCLDIQTKLGGKYQDWAKVTPLHNKFVQAILQCRCHVLVTGRAKIDYDMGKDGNNKVKIEKVGMKTITREGFDYELTMAFKLNQDNYAQIDKDRTALFKEAIPFKIDESTGKLARDWNESGKEPLPNLYEVIIGKYRKITKDFTNKDLLKKLVEMFGSSEEIRNMDHEAQENILSTLDAQEAMQSLETKM